MTNNIESINLYSISQLALIKKCSRQAIYQFIKRNNIIGTKFGSIFLFSESDKDAIMKTDRRFRSKIKRLNN